MEPNRDIDTDFREKLNKREIMPSAQSWDRLDAMLSVAAKPEKRYGWMYVAAGLAGFLLIATIFFSSTQEMTDVQRKVAVETIPLNPDGTSVKENQSSVVSEESVVVANKGLGQETVAKKIRKNTVLPAKGNAHPGGQPVTEFEKAGSQVAGQSIINQKPEQGVSIRKPAYVDVDELLASVEGSSKTPSVLSRDQGVKVNAEGLLSQVDGELDLSFREKVIKSVNRNYRHVKVALSNRNHE